MGSSRNKGAYDFAGRLADLCQAWDSHRRPIAAEILGEMAQIVEERDRYRAALERIYQQGRGPHVEIAREALNAD